jgi:hypothetical protein
VVLVPFSMCLGSAFAWVGTIVKLDLCAEPDHEFLEFGLAGCVTKQGINCIARRGARTRMWMKRIVREIFVEAAG